MNVSTALIGLAQPDQQRLEQSLSRLSGFTVGRRFSHYPRA